MIPSRFDKPLGPTITAEGPKANSTYDYVVVGSGPGGAPLAARLALANYSVLLIDAGEDQLGGLTPLSSKEEWLDTRSKRKPLNMFHVLSTWTILVGL